MLSLPGGDEGNEKHQVPFDAWGRQDSLLNATERNGSADKMSFSVYFIIGSPSKSLSWCLCMSVCPIIVNGRVLVRQVCTLLWISHGLAMADRSQAVIIMALETQHMTQIFMSVYMCWYVPLCMCLCLHDNLFACGLQHHVLGPVIPVLIGLGLVHNLLEHCPLPAQKQHTAPIPGSFIHLYLMCCTRHWWYSFLNMCILHLILPYWLLYKWPEVFLIIKKVWTCIMCHSVLILFNTSEYPYLIHYSL